MMNKTVRTISLSALLFVALLAQAALGGFGTGVLPGAASASPLALPLLVQHAQSVPTACSQKANALLTVDAGAGAGDYRCFGGTYSKLVETTSGGLTKLSSVTAGTTSNTDLTGRLTLSSGTATYSFSKTYTNAPNCVASDNTAAAAVKTVTTTTQLTVTGTGTDAVTYICVLRD